MIKPTIGRVVLYRPDAQFEETVRHAATVAHVYEDGTINIGVVDSNGVAYNEQRVTLVQGDDVPEPGQCEWMEYQKIVAKRDMVFNEKSETRKVVDHVFSEEGKLVSTTYADKEDQAAEIIQGEPTISPVPLPTESMEDESLGNTQDDDLTNPESPADDDDGEKINPETTEDQDEEEK